MFRSALFLGPCNHFGGYLARLAQVGTEQVDEEDSSECHVGLFKVYREPLAKLGYARGQLLDFGRGVAP